MRRYLMILPLLLLSWAPPSGAQERRGDSAAGRGALEQRFRMRLGAVMRERLGLTDDQARRLGEVNQRFEGQRRTFIREEGAVRREMRQVLRPGVEVNQDSVARLLDRALRIERQRVDLIEAEQRELAAFLTPSQRAMYLGMQEQLRRQMDDMRERRGIGGPGDGPPGPGRRLRRPPG